MTFRVLHGVFDTAGESVCMGVPTPSRGTSKKGNPICSKYAVSEKHALVTHPTSQPISVR